MIKNMKNPMNTLCHLLSVSLLFVRRRCGVKDQRLSTVTVWFMWRVLVLEIKELLCLVNEKE